MKKLTLNLEALAVASFHTSPLERDVQGCAFAWSDDSVCPGTTTTRTLPP
jgi:hypothetical protein